MFLDPEDSDNFGPHCRNCHSGASSCNQCHQDTGKLKKYDITPNSWTKTAFDAQGYVQSSAAYDVAQGCIDGGFSWPHRTLGANMLKDEMYGIDFNGSVMDFAIGNVRMADGASRVTSAGTTFTLDESTLTQWTGDASSFDTAPPTPTTDDSNVIVGAQVENLDSVCIDCHGDGTYWNGDDTTYYSSHTSTYDGSYTASGWELILKGLP